MTPIRVLSVMRDLELGGIDGVMVFFVRSRKTVSKQLYFTRTVSSEDEFIVRVL